MQDELRPSTSTSVLLGYGPMDTIHAEFDVLVRATLAGSDAEFHALLLPLIAHLQRHFGEEDAWMRETGFPPGDCHIDEHAAVLRSAAEVEPLVAAGRIDIGRSFVEELARWFPGHADYLDSALAAWMCKRQYGGKPVVIQRRKDGPA
jgi:hemerythrin